MLHALATHAHHFHALYYVTHLPIHGHSHRVWVDISGNGWLSKHDAVRESHRLLRWLASLGF